MRTCGAKQCLSYVLLTYGWVNDSRKIWLDHLAKIVFEQSDGLTSSVVWELPTNNEQVIAWWRLEPSYSILWLCVPLPDGHNCLNRCNYSVGWVVLWRIMSTCGAKQCLPYVLLTYCWVNDSRKTWLNHLAKFVFEQSDGLPSLAVWELPINNEEVIAWWRLATQRGACMFYSTIV